MSREEFIEKSIKIHGDKYSYLNVIYVNNKTKVELLCEKHGSFTVRPDTHLCNKNGCPYCAIENRGNKLKNTKWREDFIETHGDKYDYSEVEYINSKTKVKIICKSHGVFLMKPNAHVFQRQGFPRCSKPVIDKDTFIQESIRIHGDKYNYSDVLYKRSLLKVKIGCKTHGEFLIRPNDHLSGQGCTQCGKQSCSDSKRKDVSILIGEFSKLNGNLYDYSKVIYKNNGTKIKITCKKHGAFEQTAKSHLKGDGCPKCTSSKGERRIIALLDKYNIRYEFQRTFNGCLSINKVKLKFDFYLPEYNRCVEFDGEQHYKAVEYFGGTDGFNKLKENDNIKNEYCYKNNIELIRIPYYEYKNIEKILKIQC